MAARSVLRFALRPRLASATTAAAAAKPAASPFSIPKKSQTPLSHPTFRSPVELSCCVETLLPYHTATASALLTSMLAVSQRSYAWTAWTPEGC